MAQKVLVSLVDDLDGSEAGETVEWEAPAGRSAVRIKKVS